MFYLQTAATETPVGAVQGYKTRELAVADATPISYNRDIPIDVVEIRDADRVYPCGCSDKVACDDHQDR